MSYDKQLLDNLEEILNEISHVGWVSVGPDFPFVYSKEAYTKALLSALQKHGWRKCASGQNVTQYCSYAEVLAIELKEIEKALDDPRAHNTHTLVELIRELKEKVK